jgi:hypothetical protein
MNVVEPIVDSELLTRLDVADAEHAASLLPTSGLQISYAHQRE